MRTSRLTDAILCSPNDDLNKMTTEILRIRGVPNILGAANADECVEALGRLPKALLVIDWDLGPAEVVRVLAANRADVAGQLRSSLLIAPVASEQIVTTAAEYNVSQIFTDQVTQKNLAGRLTGLIVGDMMPEEVRSGIAAAQSARLGGDLKGCGTILQRLLAKHPNNLRLRCDLAELLLQLDDVNRAHKLLEHMPQTKPPYLRGISLLGRCLLKMGRTADALPVLEQAHLFNPYNCDRLVDIGQTLMRLERFKEAMQSFDEALQIEPEHREAKVGMGQVQLMDGHVNEALKILREVSSDLELASIFNTCAIMTIRQGHHAQAMSLYQSGVGVLMDKPKIQARLHFNMGIGYRRAGKRAQALSAFQESLRLDPRFTRAQEQVEQLNKIPETGVANTGVPPSAALNNPLPSDAAASADFDEFTAIDSVMDEDLEEKLFNRPMLP